MCAADAALEGAVAEEAVQLGEFLSASATALSSSTAMQQARRDRPALVGLRQPGVARRIGIGSER
jgi:hypothetical protein